VRFTHKRIGVFLWICGAFRFVSSKKQKTTKNRYFLPKSKNNAVVFGRKQKQTTKCKEKQEKLLTNPRDYDIV